MPKIILKFGVAVIKEIPITKDITTVGRKPDDNDIVIDNPAVSGHHLKIYIQDGSYFVEDLGSTNGTFLNETKILKASLKNRDQIGVAKHTLLFINEETATAQPAEKKPISSFETIVIDSSKLREMLNASPTGSPAQKVEKIGALKVVNGVVDQTEIELPGLLVYIGTGRQAQIKIRGMFAPSVAAAISRRPEGYLLKSVKENYPKINGMSIRDQMKLNDGDVLEFGKTKMVFFEKEKK